ncbi:MAG: Nif3-like dinuclear metal center hexameric protein [Firmicutes bacterium]|nr:Nif3-like dinuclear metal center hexameric protein [Bacillota bacterium]
MKKQVLLDILNKIAPFDLAEDWDNCGMQVDLGKTEIDKVYVALEVSDEIIDRAAECGADMIITHHPLLLPRFELGTVSAADPVGRWMIKLIEKGIELCSIHTCYDAAPGGLNDQLPRLLGLKDVQVLPGNIARIGKLAAPVRFGDFEKTVSEVLCHPVGAKSFGAKEQLISKVAVCTGTGEDYWREVVAAGADVYLTSDLGHHEAGYIKDTGKCCISAGHAGTEWIFVPCFAYQLEMESVGRLEVIQCPDHQEPFERNI